MGDVASALGGGISNLLGGGSSGTSAATPAPAASSANPLADMFAHRIIGPPQCRGQRIFAA